jgi:hypothetical protein
MYSGYLSDTISLGRLTMKLGVRFDRQKPWLGTFTGFTAFTQDSDETYLENYYEIWQNQMGAGLAEKIDALFPAIETPDVKPDFYWDFISPRIGLTWDIFGDGKTIAKVNFGMYGEQMGSYGAYYWQYGGLGGGMDFWWHDENSDSVIDMSELYWANKDTKIPYKAFDAAGNFQGDWDSEFGYLYSGWDPEDPTALSDPYYVVDPDWQSNRTTELLFTIEKELTPDIGVGLDVTYRYMDRFHRYEWYWPETGHIRDKNDYMIAGQLPASINGTSLEEGAGENWYVLKDGVEYTDYRYVTNWPKDRHDTYIGADFRFNKRMSNNWMLSGSFTLQKRRRYYGENGYANPSDLWALDSQMYAYNIGGASGKLSQPAFSTWLLKLQAMYQLPWDVNVAATLTGRQGYVVPYEFTIHDDTLPNPDDRDERVYFRPFGSGDRLPNMFNVNLRVEKVFRIGDVGNVYVMADIFNVLNADTLERQRGIYLGDYYIDTDTYSAYTRSGEANAVLNPRVVRFGVRFNF